MRNFIDPVKADTAVLFYFQDADDLRRFESFAVEATTGPNGDTWLVTGKVVAEESRENVAEFPSELYASIFRSMAEGYITSVSPAQKEGVRDFVRRVTEDDKNV